VAGQRAGFGKAAGGFRSPRAGRERGRVGRGLVRMAGRAHSVRPQSCDSPSSPEPSASWFGEGASSEGAELGLRAGMGGFGMGGGG
jgi:hypothetical protein